MSLSDASRFALRRASGDPLRLSDDCPGRTVRALRVLDYVEPDTRRLTQAGKWAKRRAEGKPPACLQPPA